VIYINENFRKKIEKIINNSTFRKAKNLNKSRGLVHGLSVKTGKNFGSNLDNLEKNEKAKEKSKWIRQKLQILMLNNPNINKKETIKFLEKQWNRLNNTKEVNDVN